MLQELLDSSILGMIVLDPILPVIRKICLDLGLSEVLTQSLIDLIFRVTEMQRRRDQGTFKL